MISQPLFNEIHSLRRMGARVKGIRHNEVNRSACTVTPFSHLSSRAVLISRHKAGRSSGVREVTMLPFPTTSGLAPRQLAQASSSSFGLHAGVRVRGWTLHVCRRAETAWRSPRYASQGGRALSITSTSSEIRRTSPAVDGGGTSNSKRRSQLDRSPDRENRRTSLPPTL